MSALTTRDCQPCRGAGGERFIDKDEWIRSETWVPCTACNAEGFFFEGDPKLVEVAWTLYRDAMERCSVADVDQIVAAVPALMGGAR